MIFLMDLIDNGLHWSGWKLSWVYSEQHFGMTYKVFRTVKGRI